MKWKVLREDGGAFVPVTDKLKDAPLVKGVAEWDDGFKADSWGDEQSAAISAKQTEWQMADAKNRAFACSQ